MAEEAVNTTEQTPETPPATILDSAQPKAFVNPDGTFGENWRENLPEDIRAEECWDTVTDFNNMAKQFVNQRKAIGKNKVTVPTDKSKPEEWDAFWTAAGRPKTPGDYKIDVPPELKDLFTDDRIKTAREIAHKIGVNQQQFEAFMKADMEAAVSTIQAQQKAEQQARLDAEQELRKEFGQAYDERLHVAKRVVAEAFPKEEDRMAFLEQYGNDPQFIRFASTVGSRLSESKAIVAELTSHTPMEAQKRIEELRKTPGYMDLGSKMTREEREAITAQIRELTKAAYPEPAKAGR